MFLSSQLLDVQWAMADDKRQHAKKMRPAEFKFCTTFSSPFIFSRQTRKLLMKKLL